MGMATSPRPNVRPNLVLARGQPYAEQVGLADGHDIDQDDPAGVAEVILATARADRRTPR